MITVTYEQIFWIALALLILFFLVWRITSWVYLPKGYGEGMNDCQRTCVEKEMVKMYKAEERERQNNK
jgi:hypothetical protein